MWNWGEGGRERKGAGPRGEGKDVLLIFVIFLKVYVMKRYDTRKKSSKLTKISPKSRRNVLISFVVRLEIREIFLQYVDFCVFSQYSKINVYF